MKSWEVLLQQGVAGDERYFSNTCLFLSNAKVAKLSNCSQIISKTERALTVKCVFHLQNLRLMSL